jgi:hypothetical protein
VPDCEDRDTLPGDRAEPGLITEPDPDPDPERAAVADEDAAPSEPQPVVVPGSHQYLKRWTFVWVVVAVWIIAAVIGLALYYWWYHSIGKTPAVFVALIYLVVCTVGGLLAAMVQNKPLVSALAIALMSAPFASTAAAAVLYGLYFCERAGRCLVGVIPY